MLSSAWVRHVLWHRAQEATSDERQELAKNVLVMPLEALVAKCLKWYLAMMRTRRLLQLQVSGDRDEKVAIDGCPNRPEGQGTLCRQHARALEASTRPTDGGIRDHRLRQTLHKPDDYCHLEVRLVGCADRWQPACTVSQENLATYFARRADLRIQGRRLLRKGQRSRGILAKKGRRESSFMSAWSSMGHRNRSECSIHKELDRHITAAARTAGFLTAVSESGIVNDVGELIGAESLSQRLCFRAQLKARLPSLQTVVHDDACHLRLMAEANAEGPPVAKLLSTLAYIVDEYHSSGHVGQWCSEHCMPQPEANKALLQGFPTNICEIVNSELSPLGHTIHHMGRWFCQLAVQEMVDVMNLKTLQKLKPK